MFILAKEKESRRGEAQDWEILVAMGKNME
jgi:hypothetical protein